MFTLSIHGVTPTTAATQEGLWPLRILATETATGNPARIFVMQKSTGEELQSDSFSCIASPVQMSDIAELAPSPDSSFFRVHDVTIMSRNAEAAVELEYKIKRDVEFLRDNLIAAESLAADRTVVL